MLTGEPRWEVYPGCWDDGWVLGGYTGYYPAPSQYPELVIFQAPGPTHGQMKAISRFIMRFPKIGSRIDLRIPQN